MNHFRLVCLWFPIAYSPLCRRVPGWAVAHTPPSPFGTGEGNQQSRTGCLSPSDLQNMFCALSVHFSFRFAIDGGVVFQKATPAMGHGGDILTVHQGECTVRCARAVRKVGSFGPVSPDGQGDRNNYCVLAHRTAQILTQSKNLDKAMFHTENAGLLSKSAVFALQTHPSLVVGGLQSGHGKPNLLLGAVCALCRNNPNEHTSMDLQRVAHKGIAHQHRPLPPRPCALSFHRDRHVNNTRPCPNCTRTSSSSWCPETGILPVSKVLLARKP